MKIIGITGTIGSGKTTVSGIMSKLGAYVIDADLVARGALEPTSPLIPLIKKSFGKSIMLDDDVVNRKKLGELVFSNKEALQTLNGIMLPHIKDEMYRIADVAERVYKRELVVFDAPLLIEAGLNEGLEDIWLVTASNQTKLDRIMKRDGLSAEAAQQRIDARVPDEELKKYATVIISNDNSYDELVFNVVQTFVERYGELGDSSKGKKE